MARFWICWCRSQNLAQTYIFVRRNSAEVVILKHIYFIVNEWNHRFVVDVQSMFNLFIQLQIKMSFITYIYSLWLVRCCALCWLLVFVICTFYRCISNLITVYVVIIINMTSEVDPLKGLDLESGLFWHSVCRLNQTYEQFLQFFVFFFVTGQFFVANHSV